MVIFVLAITCLPQDAEPGEDLVDFFKRVFINKEQPEEAAKSKGDKAVEIERPPAEKESKSQTKPAAGKTKPSEPVGRKEYPCPDYVPDYVCDIIKFFKPLPFTPEEEEKAATDIKVRKKVRTGLISNIEPFMDHIEEASKLLDVPQPIIISVINTESGGNPKAKNPRSTAKGLMQTIDSTYTMAKNKLKQDYARTISNPYDPRSSILAGTWYLRYVYDWAADRNSILVGGRADIENWKKALMNYYLGPGHERYLEGKYVVYPNGHAEPISNANRYVSKIMRFAETVSG